MILHHTLDMSLSNCVKYVAGFGLTMGSGPFVGHAVLLVGWNYKQQHFDTN